jgi:hypothetical protein
MLGVHQCQDGVQQIRLGDLVVHEKGLGHRAGVGHTGGLNHHAVEISSALALLLGQHLQRVAQVFADGAADAAIAHLDDLLVGVGLTRMSLSMFSSPNSFSITAIFWPCASASTRLSSVVFPNPESRSGWWQESNSWGNPKFSRWGVYWSFQVHGLMHCALQLNIDLPIFGFRLNQLLHKPR